MADPSSDSPTCQDRDYLETLESCDLIALLRLNNGSPAAAHRPQYTACGSNSMKRRSPSPSDPDASAATFSEPRPKKLFVDQGQLVSKISHPALIGPLSQSHPVLRRCDSDPTKNPIAPSFDPEPQSPKGHFVEQGECNLSGFSKISLPTSLEPQSYPVLRRSVSDLTQTNPPSAVPPFSPEQNLKVGIGPETPSPKKGGASASSSALPPLPPSLRRTVSDLSSSRTPPPKGSSCLHTAADLMEEETSDSMRLRRMKGRLAEMGQWCNEVVREEDDVNAGFEDDNNNTTKIASEADPEELVSVERVGECFTIQFKCPCGKGYQILISGNSCYYKLM